MAEVKEVPNDVLLPLVGEMLEGGHTATIRVKGVSMRPFLENNRDLVTLKAPDGPLRKGDAVLALTDGNRYVLHRIKEIVGDAVMLKGDGNLDQEERTHRGDVIGVVTHYIRPGHKTVAATSRRRRMEVALWCAMPRIMRRIGLHIYRKLL